MGGLDHTARNQLSVRAYEAVRKFGGDIGNLRVSRKAVELDLLLNAEMSLQNSLSALEAAIGPLLTVRKLDVAVPAIEKSKAISLGFELFNDERYWESHEAFESAWRESTEADKEVLQGLILVAAAFVHLQKDEENVALSVMKRSSDKLNSYGGECFGIDIDKLKQRIKEMLAVSRLEFFRIESKQLKRSV